MFSMIIENASPLMTQPVAVLERAMIGLIATRSSIKATAPTTASVATVVTGHDHPRVPIPIAASRAPSITRSPCAKLKTLVGW